MFKTFTALSALPASDVNDYLMKQAVIVCTSGTRPTGVEGMLIYETDLDLLRVYDGSTWVVTARPGTFKTYSPTVTQSGAVTLTVATGRYTHIGYKCALHLHFDFGGAGTAANAIVIGNLPAAITARAGASPDAGETYTGSGIYSDSGTAIYQVIPYFHTTTTVRFRECATGTGTGFGTVPNMAIAAADYLSLDIVYETASAAAA